MNKFNKALKKIYLIQIILDIINKYIGILLNIYIAAIIGNIFNLAIKGDVKSIINLSSKFLINIICLQLLMKIVDYYISLKSIKNKEKIKENVYGKLMDNSIEKIEKFSTGEILRRTENDLNLVIDIIEKNFVFVITSILGVITYSAYMFTLIGTFTFAIIIIALVTIIPPIVLSKKYAVSFDSYNIAADKATNYIKESLKAFDYIKLFDKYEEREKRYYNLQKKAIDIAMDIEKTASIEKVLGGVTTNVAKFSNYGLLAFLVFKGYITLGIIVTIIMLSENIVENISSIFGNYNKLTKKKISEIRINEVINSESDEINKQKQHIKFIQNITFKDVSYSYDNNYLLLNKINFSIENKDKILIYGINGSGKSTILKLILGLYENYKGEILINNINLKNIDIIEYQNKFSYVPQNQVFLEEEPLNNLKVFNNNDTIINEFISYFQLDENKLNNQSVEELSGGEREKLNIIRGVIKETKILILDEPTNHLDDESIEKLNKYINKTDKTVIVISHDDRIKNSFNKILQVENGFIRELGDKNAV